MTWPNALRHPVVLIGLVLAALTLHALAVGSHLSIVTEIVIYVLYGAGLNVMLGYTGLVPFGASVFFGIATYVAAVGIQRLVGNEVEALVLGVVVSVLLGLALGALVLLRRGLYFSLLTLACSQIAFEAALKWSDVTGGENGLQNVPRPLFGDPRAFHLVCLVLTILVLWGLWRLAHSPLGRIFQAIRENEERARSLGYDVYRLKLCSFTISGGVIGLAGGLLAFLVQGAYANNLSWQHAADALLANVLGGIHHFMGPLWGAIVFILLQDYLSAIIENWWLLYRELVASVRAHRDRVGPVLTAGVARPRSAFVLASALHARQRRPPGSAEANHAVRCCRRGGGHPHTRAGNTKVVAAFRSPGNRQ